MATKFGYVKREASNAIDWSAVASQFTDVLKAEVASREAQKKELADASREMVENLDNAPSGEYVDGNTFMANYTADASQVLLTQDRLLKQGILKPRDYSVVRANLNSSNKQMFKLGEAYQEAYKTKMERINAADPSKRAQMLEQWKMEQAEGLYNLKNTKALINPSNGMVSIGLWKDGKMVGDPGSFQTVPELMGNLAGEYDYYDVRKNVAAAVEGLGIIDEIDVKYAGQGGLDMIYKTSSQGGKYSGNDEVLKEYFEWAGYTADAMMANPLHVTSILTMEGLVDPKTKERYTYTYEPDPKKRKSNEIYLDRTNNRSGEPVFTTDQSKQVKGAIIERLNDSVDKTISTTSSRKQYKPQPVVNRENQQLEDETTFNMLSAIYYDGPEGVKAAETYFRDNFDGISEVQKKGNVIYVTMTDGTTKDVPLVGPNGQLMGFEAFAKSAVLLTGVPNILDSVELAGGLRKGKVKETRTTKTDGVYEVVFEGGRVETVKGDITTSPYKVGDTYELGSITKSSTGAGTSSQESTQAYGNRYIDTVITAENIIQKQTEKGTVLMADDEDVMPKLVPYIEGFGFSVNNKPNDIFAGDYLEISKPGATEDDTPFEFVISTDKVEMNKNLLDLRNFLKSNLPAAMIDSQSDFIRDSIGGKQSGKGGGGILDE
eukprot:COSAG02_NODE_4546_length_5228_cov_1.766231_2_plen_660_part_00